ncbi:histidinol dehydrogenase [Candidatus Sumerlaeota bacterium]|nr:histidinol dehydrogenase [Candidatus Sumerlaeota bacterium]
MRIIDAEKNPRQAEKFLSYASTGDDRRESAVKTILGGVRKSGDKAVIEFTRKFDGVTLKPSQFRMPQSRLRECWDELAPDQRKAMKLAAQRIKAFHVRQKRRSWTLSDKIGARITQRVLPLDSVGICVPGGLAPLPSTVLMCAIPAKAAGVRRIVMITPPPREGRLNTANFAAAWLAGVDEVYQIGGAQAVAALAYGTKTIPRVDKIVGPGNVYVALAKRLLYGVINIDSVAGPSEILVIADKKSNPAFVASDLLSQAEHDPDAIPICVFIGSQSGAQAIADEVLRQTQNAPRKAVIRQSLKKSGAILRVKTRAEAVALTEKRAPEHLSIQTERPRELAAAIHNAGSIFIGPWTPESVGDYTVGANHVLPTGGTARFFSPLSVDDYMTHSQLIECGRKGLERLGAATIEMAEMEGLHAHAEAVRVRLKK